MERRNASARRPDRFDPVVLETETGILAPCTFDPGTTPFGPDLVEHERRAPTRAGRAPEQPHRHQLPRLRIAWELARERLTGVERQLVHPKQIVREDVFRSLIHGAEVRAFEPLSAANLQQLDDGRQGTSAIIRIEAVPCFESHAKGRRFGAGLSRLMCARG